MLSALFSPVSFFRQRVSALRHRNDRLKADAAERRERWKQVIAEHQKPLDQRQDTATSAADGA
jgi:hypothetical protein